MRTPLILSLVYRGGTILASKRTPYEDLIAEHFDERLLEERLNRQHSLICAAIRAGRIEDLKRMTQKRASAKQPPKAVPTEINKEFIPTPVKGQKEVSIPNFKIPNPKDGKEITKIHPIEAKPEIILEKTEPEIRESRPIVARESKARPIGGMTGKQIDGGSEKSLVEKSYEPEIPKPINTNIFTDEIPMPTDEPFWDIPIIEDVTIIEDDHLANHQLTEEEFILPPEAVEIVGDLEQFGSLLENELKVKILGENQFRSGDRKNINILVCRGTDDLAVMNANVMVKVIGSDFRPLIYHSKADGNGVATVFLKLPMFRTGRAALMIRAMVDGEETELRRAITSE